MTLENNERKTCNQDKAATATNIIKTFWQFPKVQSTKILLTYWTLKNITKSSKFSRYQ